MHHILMLAALIGLQAGKLPERFTYVTTAEFSEGRCQYFTGDVVFDAGGFERDLRLRFDPSNRVAVYHLADVPRRCVRRAISILHQVGFAEVIDRVGDVDTGLPR